MRRRFVIAIVGLATFFVSAAPGAEAIHFYRGPGGGCTPTDGAITDDDPETAGPVAATVLVMHNTYNDASTLLPVTRIAAGEAVRWTWNSPHCHSIDGAGFTSGYHYPTSDPTTPQVVPGFFDHPVPELEPTLSYTATFDTPGTYQYSCVHHAAIGMVGAIVVE